MNSRTWILFGIMIAWMTHDLSGQLGIRPVFGINQARGWNDFFQEVESPSTKVFEQSFGVFLDYRIVPFEQKRIEFYPYLSYHQSSTELSSRTVGLRQIGAGVMSHVYILDLAGDCSCPTFRREGGLVKKGLFLLGGVGADYDSKAIGDLGYSDANFDVDFHLGVGLDIGINSVITTSPTIHWQYYPELSWHELGPPFGRPSGNVSTSLSRWMFGVRFSYSPE